jgi:hypothetical protein
MSILVSLFLAGKSVTCLPNYYGSTETHHWRFTDLAKKVFLLPKTEGK